MAASIERIQKKASNGLIVEKCTLRSRSDNPFVILLGLGAEPPLPGKRGYVGEFPDLLSRISGDDVFVVYQAGVSANGHRPGLYTNKTEKLMLDAAREVTTGKDWYPISHSMACHLHSRFLAENSLYGSDISDILDGAMIAPMTTAKDALTNPDGSPMRLFGVKWYSIFRIAMALPEKESFVLPIYPLRHKELHDGKNDSCEDSAPGVSKYVDCGSARAVLSYDILNELAGKKMLRKPLVVIPEEDRIFDPSGQMRIASAIGSETIIVESGHRFFTSDEALLESVIRRIIRHKDDSLKGF